jgi:hypothetical protein
MNDNQLRNFYRTSDTSLATYLFSEGFQIIDIDYSNQRAEFVFKDNSPPLNEAVRLYSIGKTQVDAATYARLHRKLTKIVVNQTPWTEGVINA